MIYSLEVAKERKRSNTFSFGGNKLSLYHFIAHAGSTDLEFCFVARARARAVHSICVIIPRIVLYESGSYFVVQTRFQRDSMAQIKRK